MGNFHRFIDPTYPLFAGESFPGSPGGSGTIGLHSYDRLNVISGGAGGSGSSNADVQKSTGVNVYTYFVAFSEDATSQNVNRGFRALAENCDVLDDLFRTSIPKVSEQVVVGASQNRVVLTGDVFVGDAGASVADLIAFQVLDGTLSRPYNTGTAIDITDIDDGTPASTVVGTGYYTNPTVQLSAPLPVGASYRFVFFIQTSTARIVEAEREELSKRDVEGLQAAFDASRVFSFGLNEFYRRALSKPSVYNNDVPGDGGLILRDGAAVVARPTGVADWTATPYTDPFLSNFRVDDLSLLTATTLDRSKSGDMGFVYVNSWRHTESDASERSKQNRGLAGFASLNVRGYTTPVVAGTGAYTFLSPGGSATLNVGGADTDSVTTGSGWFRDGSSDTALLLGYDLLHVERASGVEETYVIAEIVSASTVRLLTLGGGTPIFPADEAVSITWVQPMFTAGGGIDNTGSDVQWSPLTVVFPTLPTTFGAGINVSLAPIRFIGERSARVLLSCGYHDPATGVMSESLRMLADGRLQATGDAAYAWMSRRKQTYETSSASSTPSLEVDPLGVGTGSAAGKDHIDFELSDATPTLTVTTASTSSSGQQFTLVIRHSTAGQVTLAWQSGPDRFIFSGSDGTFPPTTTTATYKYQGVWSGRHDAFLMTRTDYSI